MSAAKDACREMLTCAFHPHLTLVLCWKLSILANCKSSPQSSNGTESNMRCSKHLDGQELPCRWWATIFRFGFSRLVLSLMMVPTLNRNTTWLMFQWLRRTTKLEITPRRLVRPAIWVRIEKLEASLLQASK